MPSLNGDTEAHSSDGGRTLVDRTLDFHIDSGQVVPTGQPARQRPDRTSATTVPAIQLPAPTPHVLKTLLYFQQATASQLRRLHYRGTERGAIVRSSKHLKRLADMRIVRRVWGVYGWSPEYVYMPADSKARGANQHTLDITELYVRLDQFRDTTNLIFDPEPARWYKVGPTGLRPDAYIDVGSRYFLEMDRGTEYRAALTKKMRLYFAAFDSGTWPEPKFPRVLFVCHDPDRLRFIEKVIADQPEPELFAVALFGEAASYMAGGNNGLHRQNNGLRSGRAAGF